MNAVLRARLRALLAVATMAVLVACGGSRAPLFQSTDSLIVPPRSAVDSPITLKLLSTRADLVSGGDALMEVVLPAGLPASAVKVDVGGRDVSNVFALRSNGRFTGLVGGLVLGENTVTAKAGSASSSLVLVNHPDGGPLIAGPQLTPWTCLNGSKDPQCAQAPAFSYVYVSTNPLKPGFQNYDPASPPSDVASTTTGNGTTVPFIVRIETGYQDRDQYKIAVLFQPGKDWSGNEPQPQFDHKLLITHGVSCGVDYQTGTAPGVTAFNPVDVTGAGLPTIGNDSAQYALGKGFAVMSTALDYSGHNCNLPLQAESLIMAKERLVKQYGTLRYTIGTGCSGGSLAQQWIANAYPGIYQGILPTCSFADAWGTATQFADYHLLLAYFQNPAKWGSGVLWLEPQMADVQGHISIVNSLVSDNAQFHVAVATDSCSGISDAQRYNPSTNPGGVRCTIQDAAINTLGPRPPELWTDNEKKIGRGFAGFPIDNVGVQYGLSSLQKGLITAAQFVDMNVKIGGLDVDTNPIAARTPAVEPALTNAYRSGMINEANNLDQTAIIDCRGPDPGAFHDAYRAFAVRSRLDRAHGNHDNQLIWEGPVLIVGDAQCAYNSLVAIDRWLAAVEADTSNKPIARKLTANRPSDLGDQCYSGAGVKVADGLCGPVVVPVYGTPRMVAGDAITTDTNKCQLKPLNRNDDYGPLGAATFTDAQWAQLQKVFADGVCDFSKPGVSQQGTVPWQTYQDTNGRVIYGGAALPAAPANSGSGWASPAFAVFGN
jgi:Tannase-like family of unknown function (DUF6351)